MNLKNMLKGIRKAKPAQSAAERRREHDRKHVIKGTMGAVAVGARLRGRCRSIFTYQMAPRFASGPLRMRRPIDRVEAFLRALRAARGRGGHRG